MSENLYNMTYNPDVLNCLANLSNDEVFTPPELVNKILDMLPDNLWGDEKATFLDPACKSGAFLREIAKRLMKGLEKKIPDEQERRHHIFHNQLYGIAITELTSLLSRRSVYCSKFANSRYSISSFENPNGNIRFKSIEHLWKNGKCVSCGASQIEHEHDAGLETHAYEWIHVNAPEEIFSMKFDVIVGNPPYQLDDGGAGASASPLYHKFVQQAMKLNPRFITMIIPSRWFSGGKGLDEFRDVMLQDNRITDIHDFPASSDCFPGVEIKGGVCYFLWQRDSKQNTCRVSTHIDESIVSEAERPLLEEGQKTFIRWNEAISILRKITSKKEKSFERLVSSRKPFGFPTNFDAYKKDSDGLFSITILTREGKGFVSQPQISKNNEWVDQYKIFISKGYGAGETYPHQIINVPLLGMPHEICTETFLVIGPFENKDIAENVMSYVSTKFFRFLVMLIKNTQDAAKNVYSLVPEQDFLNSWDDEKLYQKYNLTDAEISFIDRMIRPMSLHGETNEE